jgi:pyruvate dehydrogenase E2 component (dihydrolipoamide acetyltransferase)
MTTFNLPDLGEGLHEAEIVEWHVKPGDEVEADAPLVAVETDKAVVEVPAPRTARVTRLFAKIGDIVPVGAPLVAFEGGTADAGTVVGEIPSAAEPWDEASVGENQGSASAVRATPAVRASARRLGVDLALVEASGPGGAITSADVERAAAELAKAGPLEPLRGVRRAMAARMVHAHSEVVPATVSDDADVEAWVDQGDITIRIVRAIARASAAEPALNVWYDPKQQGRRLHEKVDLGIAVDTEDGLFVPVLRDVGKRSAKELRQGLDRMRADIVARKIPAEELRGATISLSNFGMLAGRYAAPGVVPPQVAILSTGRVVPRVVAHDGAPAVHRLMPLSLTFDHRVVTGGEAARFLAAVIKDLEEAGR